MELFNSFPVSIQNNEIGKRVFKRIEDSFYDKNIGSSMLDFGNVEVYDIDGNKKLWKDLFVKTTEYKIIVFGASWCSPCLIQERSLKKYYTSIDSSKIEIVGISIDNSVNKFAAYLQRENFPWNAYRVDGEAENPIMKKLDFTGIPRNFLVDSNGKIVKEDLNILEILKFLKIELKAIDVRS
ncbi:MAG: redoxin domain-containing protein [Sphingobacteriales bacterium]|nr:MAG: redoxin domain-containing protein [Sphingobacteriales bacterium]